MHMCYHAEFGRSVSKGVGINSLEGSQNWGALGSRPIGVLVTHRNTPLSICIILKNLFVVSESILRNYGDTRGKLTPGVSPFKVIEGHRNQQGSIGYL